MTSFALKIIAAACMLIDHIGAVFSGPGQAPEYFRFIGRIAFPIYAFMVAQGCRRTRSIGKYMLRLALFAAISEAPFDLAFIQPFGNDGISFLSHTNVFFTLFFGAASIAAFEKLRAAKLPWLGAVAAFVPMFLAHALDTDYGAFGVALIFVLYAALYAIGPDSGAMRCAILAAGMLYLYGGSMAELLISRVRGESVSPNMVAWAKNSGLPMLLCSLVAPVLVLLYNGKLGGARREGTKAPAPESARTPMPALAPTPASAATEPASAPAPTHAPEPAPAPAPAHAPAPAPTLAPEPAPAPSPAFASTVRATAVKWAFYAFYPAHIIALVLIRDYIL